MSTKEQKDLFEKINKISHKFNEKDKEKFQMLLKRHKDDEDLDQLSLNYLRDLVNKYQDNSKSENAKKNLDNLFKK